MRTRHSPTIAFPPPSGLRGLWVPKSFRVIEAIVRTANRFIPLNTLCVARLSRRGTGTYGEITDFLAWICIISGGNPAFFTIRGLDAIRLGRQTKAHISYSNTLERGLLYSFNEEQLLRNPSEGPELLGNSRQLLLLGTTCGRR